MKKIGNITSIILSLGLAVALALMIFKPTTAPIRDKNVSDIARPLPPKLETENIQPLQLAAIALPSPPARQPVTAKTTVKSKAKITQIETPKPSTEKPVIRPLEKSPAKQTEPVKFTSLKVKKAKPVSRQETKAIAIKPLEIKTQEAPAKKIHSAKAKPLKPAQQPVKNAEAEPVVAFKEIEETIPKVTVSQSSQETKTGRALLKLLEHGTGPSIEIAWPDSAQQQAQLHDIFKQCFGMVTAVMDIQGHLYRRQDNRGEIWNINTDNYSGFVRQASGRQSANERKTADTIRQYHKVSRNSQMVRVFPRQIDALLLGGLHRLIGPDYKKHNTIQARYQLRGGGVKIGNLNVDGAPLDGVIALHINPACQGGYAL